MMKNEEASQRTISVLINIARKHFTQHGYHEVSLERIAEEGNVTRGAIYHHFKNKKGLFLAVLDLVQQDIARQIEKEAMQSDDLWQQLILGCFGFVKSANKVECRRILLVDAPAAAGWDEWRKSDQENAADVLRKHLADLHEKGWLAEHVDVKWMTYAISGALNELALAYPVHASAKTDEAITDAISRMVCGFRRG